MTTTKNRRPTCCIRLRENVPAVEDVGAKNDVLAHYKLQRVKCAADLEQKQTKANVDFILQEEENVKQDILKFKDSIKDVERIISSSLCKTKHPTKLSTLCKLKSGLQVELSNAIKLQSQLKGRLCAARLACRNAKLDGQIVLEEIRKLRSEQWEEHIIQKEDQAKRRLRRELLSKDNAKRAREDMITSVANSITVHVLEHPERDAAKKQFEQAKTARKSIDRYIARTFLQAKEKKAVAIAEAEMRHRRQQNNLAKLRREIQEIKETLTVKNHLKRMHDEEIAIEKEEVKSLLLAEGANPYLAEYLLAIEEKQREIQRKMLVEEQKRLLDMQREYAIIEASKAKEDTDKKKWSEYWDNKVKEKVARERKTKMEMYFDFEGDEDEMRESLGTAEQELQEESEVEEIVNNIRDSQLVTVTPIPEAIPEDKPGEDTSKPKKSTDSKQSSRKKSSGRGSTRSKGSKKDDMQAAVVKDTPSPRVTDGSVVISTRKAVQLDYVKKEKLSRMAGEDRSESRIMLMDGKNAFDFGEVPVGDKKYIFVNVANVSMDTVKLKMSVVNPYGPFAFSNALKDIPADNYYTLKFKFQPTTLQESQETVKITEDGYPNTTILIILKGRGGQTTPHK